MTIRRIYAVLVVAAGVLAARVDVHAQSIWTGADALANINTNWSDTINWAGGEPGSGSSVIFSNDATAKAASPFFAVGAGTNGGIENPQYFNSIVDTGFGGTIASLTYTNLGNFQNTLLAPGVILTASGFTVGSSSADFGANTLENVTIAGTNSTLNVPNNGSGTLFIGLESATGGSHMGILDMSGLGAFNADIGTFSVGAISTTTVRPSATVYLARTNVITAASTTAVNETASGSPAMVAFNVGISGDAASEGSVLDLGWTNTINANNIQIGCSKQSPAVMQFNPVFANTAAPASGPTAVIRANDGISPVTLWTMGDGFGQTGASSSPNGTADFSGGTVNALVTTIQLGRTPNPTSGTAASTGTLKLGAGSFSAGTIYVGYQIHADGDFGVGTININGPATLSVSTLYLPNTAGGSGSSSTTGTLSITGGTVVAGTIVADSHNLGVGTINVFTNGTLIVTNTMGTSASPITFLTISNAVLNLSVPASGAPAYVYNFHANGTTNQIGIGSLNGTISGYPAVFPLIQYTNSSGPNGPPFAVFNIGLESLPAPYTGFISNDVANNAVDLVVINGPTPARHLIWAGAVGGNPTSAWDIGTTADWLSNSIPVTYNDNGGQGGDFVAFNDGVASSIVTLAATVHPSGINITNNVLNYTINDNGSGYSLAGGGGINKQGSQSLLLDNSGGVTMDGETTIGAGTVQVGNNDTYGGLPGGIVANNGTLIFNRNDGSLVVPNAISGSGSFVQAGSGTLELSGGNTFSGGVTVSNGTLQAGNASAFGSGNAAIISGAGLDVNGNAVATSPGVKQVFVSGAGPSGNGAILNNSVEALLAFTNITLTGDTTFGGSPGGGGNFGSTSNRWDLRSPAGDAAPPGATLSTGGQPYNLTKVGNNFIGIVSAVVDPALANVDVQGGILDYEGSTTGLGNPADSLSVEATLEFWNSLNPLNKVIVMNSGSYLYNGQGNNTVIGPMTLNGNVTVNPIVLANGTGTLMLSNTISGSGSLTKDQTNTLILAGLDSYSGGTIVNNGTLLLDGINTATANTLTVYPNTLGVPATVGGNGTNAGPVSIQDTLWPGAGGAPATFGSGAMSLGGTVIFSLNSPTTAGGGVNDLVNVQGDFDPAGATLEINPLGTLNLTGVYTLVNYSGNLVNNDHFGAVQLVAGRSRYQFTVNYPPNQVTLSVTGGPNLLKWNNGSGNGQWDLGSSANWTNVTSAAAHDVFYNGDTVIFDDSITNAPSPDTNIAVSAPSVAPTAITNNSSVNYTINGPGAIVGATSITKLGSGTLTLTYSNNTYSGGVMINGGTVQVFGTNGFTALGSGTPTVNAGTTLIGLNHDAFGYEPHPAPTNIVINGGIVSDLGTASYRITMPDIIFVGGTLTSGAGNTGDTDGNYSFLGNGSNCIVSTVGASSTALISAGTVSCQAPVTFDIASGSVTGGSTPGVDLLVTSKLVPNGLEPVLKTGTGDLTVDNTNSSTWADPVTITTGTLQLGTVNDTTPLISPIGTGAVTNNATLLFASSQSVSIPNLIHGSGALNVNSGTAILSAANSYSGNTTVSGGTLIVNGTSGSGAIAVNSGGTLAGIGTLSGTVTVNSGGTISPGTNGAIGKLTATANVALAGTTTMKLNHATATNDVLSVAGTLTYGGTLNLTNIAGTLAASDSFKLFNAASYNGSFPALSPATPGPGLLWNTNNLAVNGTVSVVSTAAPKITGVAVNGATLTIHAINGPDGGNFVLLESTNVTLPLPRWTPVLTNAFDVSGDINLSTNIINPGIAEEFYILQVP